MCRIVAQPASKNIAKPRATASFDAKRLYANRKLAEQGRALAWCPYHVADIEFECRRIAAALIAGEQVSA